MSKAIDKENIKAIRHEVLEVGEDIIRSDRFEKAKHVSHHIRFTVAEHSVEVAMYALLIARWLRKKGVHIEETDAVRAALLHDIGMTENNVHDSPSYRKAFSHPREGHRIARDEFNANRTQLDAIRYHMWPICIKPPRHIIGWILFTADKLSTINEGLIIAKSRNSKSKKED